MPVDDLWREVMHACGNATILSLPELKSTLQFMSLSSLVTAVFHCRDFLLRSTITSFVTVLPNCIVTTISSQPCVLTHVAFKPSVTSAFVQRFALSCCHGVGKVLGNCGPTVLSKTRPHFRGITAIWHLIFPRCNVPMVLSPRRSPFTVIGLHRLLIDGIFRK